MHCHQYKLKVENKYNYGITMRECEICGWNIEHRYKSARYCRFCSVIIKRIQTTVSDLKRPDRREYHQYYHKYLRKGTSNIGCHRNNDFNKELDIIRFEKKKILKYGFSQFNPIFGDKENGNGHQDRTRNLYSYDVYSNHLYPKKCDECLDGIIVIPEIPRSYDFNKDGFVMPFCSNCGVVID